MPALVIWAVAPVSAVDLELAKLRVEGGEVQFRASGPRPLASLPIDRDGRNVQTAQTPHFMVYADLDSIEYADRGSYFRYQLYVEPRPGTAGGLEQLTVKGSPVGSFLPQMADIDFTLGSGAASEPGTITLPVFSLDEPKYLSLEDWGEPAPLEVELPGGRQVPLHLKNLLHLPVRVVDIRQPSRRDVWRELALRPADAQSFKPFQISPVSKADDRLVLDLHPGLGATLEALFSRARNKPHETVQASLTCATPWDGLPQQDLAITLPVRFVPWPPLLFLSVLIGTLLGSSLPVLLGRRQLSNWPRAFLLSLLVAFVAEVIAMVLVQFDSQFRLLGLELDPFQLLPAALIGILMGLLGFKSLEALRKLIPGGGPEHK
jgi:hypothetical protein